MNEPLGARGRAVIRIVLAGTATLALGVPAWVVTHPPAIPHAAVARVKLPPRRVVPPAELPPVEPVRLVDLSPDDARAFNASVPFSTDSNPAARPFRYVGSADDLARATDCLAAGVLYEAGDDATGERAVAQVVLNRLRHPAFPKTVCGVVFEGQDRSTGCQFTFSCDGALTRWKPGEAAWTRARAVAAMALSGSVYRPVGYATHYHTDWVVPYWQASLDKIAAVGSHLFFRWSGWWGTPPAFNRHMLAGEPVVAQLAPVSYAHKTGAALVEAQAALAEAAAATTGAQAVTVAGTSDSFLVTLPHGVAPETYPALAAKACGDRPVCKFSGWTDATRTPAALPLEAAQIATMSFSYMRDRAAGIEKSLWNCQQTPRPVRTQCMKQQVMLTAAPAATVTPSATPTPAPAPEQRGPAELGGVRRKGDEPVSSPARGGGSL
ncbi:cell wall hydrolase [Sphingomonas sp. FARSPH]|nr:cell wall hydrolase [Sphingomonas sp. FARSPH]